MSLLVCCIGKHIFSAVNYFAGEDSLCIRIEGKDVSLNVRADSEADRAFLGEPCNQRGFTLEEPWYWCLGLTWLGFPRAVAILFQAFCADNGMKALHLFHPGVSWGVQLQRHITFSGYLESASGLHSDFQLPRLRKACELHVILVLSGLHHVCSF